MENLDYKVLQDKGFVEVRTRKGLEVIGKICDHIPDHKSSDCLYLSQAMPVDMHFNSLTPMDRIKRFQEHLQKYKMDVSSGAARGGINAVVPIINITSVVVSSVYRDY